MEPITNPSLQLPGDGSRARCAQPGRRRLLGLTLLALAPVGCGDSPAGQPGPTASREGFVVAATMEPVAWIAAQLLAQIDDARVLQPLAEAGDPAFATPDRQALAAFVEADLIVANGAGFERWIERASLPPSRLVRTADGLSEALIEGPQVHHRHGPRGAHTHGEIDPHTWLDARNMIEQAQFVRAALVRALPDHGPAIESASEQLAARLEALDEDLSALGERLVEQRVLAAHRAYDYLARRYGFELESLDLDPAEPLDTDAMQAIRAALARCTEQRGETAHVLLLWESEPGPATREQLERELGIESVVYSPGETPDPRGLDWLAVQRENVARVLELLED